MSTRILVTSTTAQVTYPTGSLMGYVFPDAVTPHGATSSRTATAADSCFVPGSVNYPLPANVPTPQRMSRIAVVRSIEVLSLASAGGTVSLLAGDGSTAIIPAFLSDGVLATDGKGRRVDFGPDGLPILGGFSIVTTGATASSVLVVYEILDR